MVPMSCVLPRHIKVSNQVSQDLFPIPCVPEVLSSLQVILVFALNILQLNSGYGIGFSAPVLHQV